MNLNTYQSHYDLKKLKKKALQELASDVRKLIIETVSINGGHLASNLGMVELTISLLKVFEIDNNDLILFDTGHQTYAYKILTDRKTTFLTIRLENGLGAFQNPIESQYDYLANGHAGTGLSSAIGYSYNKRHQNIICVIGDAAFTNGLTLEALTHLGTITNKVIVILNDNGMSISKNVNILHTTASKVRHGGLYRFAARVEKITRFIPPLTLLWLTHLLIKKIFKSFITPPLFAGFNLDYIGIVNGHNFYQLEKSLEQAKKSQKSVLVHVKTKKGYGYGLEQDEQEKIHSYSLITNIEQEWSYYVAKMIEAQFNSMAKKFYFISAAMQSSLYLDHFMEQNPLYCIDVGLAEEHAVTMASGLSLDHKKVVVSIYSTFLQRCYDQILHDIIRNHLPVIFLIDRASLALQDGDSHHGIYDIGMLNSMGDLAIIATPANSSDFDRLFTLAYQNTKNPFFIRYPKNGISYTATQAEFNIGQWEYRLEQPKAKTLLIIYGNNVEQAVKIINLNDNATIDVVNARFINPIDDMMIKTISNKNYQTIIIYEQSISQTGLYANILRNHPTFNAKKNVIHYGYRNGLLTKEPMLLSEIIAKLINLENGL